MARISYRVRNYQSARGSVPQMSLMDTYYQTVELRTVLKDINIQHKKWGDMWYRFVELSLFEDAKNAVITHGKGEMVITTVCHIEELADLEKHMHELEGGIN